jgi:SOS-response transcriptional repressor LexA
LRRIFPGDGLIVDRSITPANRHIVMVDIDGERSVERLLLKARASGLVIL